MKPVDRLVRDHARPVLTEAGFRRKGNRFWLTAPNGDVACVDFQTQAGVTVMRPDGVHAMPDWAAFFVNIGVVPVPRWDWLCHQFPGLSKQVPEASHGLWTSRAVAPPEVADDVISDSWVVKGADQVAVCGEHLARVLRDDVVPLLVWCLDRAEFLALCRDPARPLDPPPSDAELILLVDDGPSPDLDAALAVLGARDPHDYPVAAEYAAWLRARAAVV